MLRPRVLTLVALAALVVSGCGTDDAGSAGSDGRPEAPEGMQLIGAEGIVIAVPQSWAQVENDECDLVPPDRSYQLHHGAKRSRAELAQLAERCRDPARLAERGNPLEDDESLAVLTGHFYLTSVSATAEPEPEPIHSSRGGVTTDLITACDHLYCSATWIVTDEGMALAVRVPVDGGQEVIDRMDSSIRRLPDGWTTSETDGTVVPDED